jgi:hypothetical protein
MTIGIDLLILILFAHWVADFIGQTHWMATNKSKNWTALTSHVAVYTSIMTLFMAFALPGPAWVAFIGITFFTHFITDAITSRITSWLWAKGDIHNFFVVVGFDQLIHYTTLIGTVLLLSNA